MTKAIRLVSVLRAEDAAALAGTFPGASDYDLVVGGPDGEDVDVLKPDGSPLLVYRRGVLPPGVCRRAYPVLRKAATPTTNRGVASGGKRSAKVKQDGTLDRATYAPAVESGIIGYYGRTARLPVCRATAFTAREVEGWAGVQPFLRAVNAVFARELPDRYAAQLAAVCRTPSQYVIAGTVFSTVTVNRNYRSAVHKDAGDLPEGFGVLSVLRAGDYSGGLLVFPRYGVAVDLRTRDVLLADVHEWHGNTALVGTEGEYERISCVLYFRREMVHCLPPAEELEWAKRRRPGDPLAGPPTAPGARPRDVQALRAPAQRLSRL
jgi:hypothetical protein